MRPPLALKAGDLLIPYSRVKQIDIASVEQAEITILTDDGQRIIARGFDAIEAIMAIKPSALEGRRLKWQQGAWAFHNVVGHPVMQVLAWVGLKKLAIHVHDVTTPTPRDFR